MLYNERWEQDKKYRGSVLRTPDSFLLFMLVSPLLVYERSGNQDRLPLLLLIVSHLEISQDSLCLLHVSQFMSTRVEFVEPLLLRSKFLALLLDHLWLCPVYKILVRQFAL